MLTRRRFLLSGAVLFAGGGLAAGEAAAMDPYLLEDILQGVSDTLIRDYIRSNYRYGHWDGHYWWRDGWRLSVGDYRGWLIDAYYGRPWGRPYGHYRPNAYNRFDRYDRPPRPHHRPPQRPPRPDHRPPEGVHPNGRDPWDYRGRGGPLR